MKAGPEKELADRYFDRLSKSGSRTGLEFGGLIEIPESRSRTAPERRREEAARLGAQLLSGRTLLLLDEGGSNLSSAEFAACIGRLRDAGRRELLFAIGGPDGHDASLAATAEMSLSFGAQTWPHQLVRVMLGEQLYRAATILSGHPYHRE
jgi:23S rRNA (pseudouridine1915-N3)-methyltransferase